MVWANRVNPILSAFFSPAADQTICWDPESSTASPGRWWEDSSHAAGDGGGYGGPLGISWDLLLFLRCFALFCWFLDSTWNRHMTSTDVSIRPSKTELKIVVCSIRQGQLEGEKVGCGVAPNPGRSSWLHHITSGPMPAMTCHAMTCHADAVNIARNSGHDWFQPQCFSLSDDEALSLCGLATLRYTWQLVRKTMALHGTVLRSAPRRLSWRTRPKDCGRHGHRVSTCFNNVEPFSIFVISMLNLVKQIILISVWRFWAVDI